MSTKNTQMSKPTKKMCICTIKKKIKNKWSKTNKKTTKTRGIKQTRY